jgi:RND family efflux transporter MFP subunit
MKQHNEKTPMSRNVLFRLITLSPCHLVTLSFLLVGCGPPAVEKSKDAIRVTVGKATVEVIPYYEYFTGYTKAIESVDVRARVNGYLDKIFFKEGDVVKEDQKLFEIDPRPYQAAYEKAGGELEAAKAIDEAKQIEFKRQKGLYDKGAIAEADYVQAKAQAGVAAADVKAKKAALDQAKLNLDFTLVKSPIDGKVSLANITRGNLVNADVTQLTSVVSAGPIYAYFNVDENTVLNIKERIRQGKMKDTKPEDVPVDMKLANEKEYSHHGMLNFVNTRIDPKTGTLQVRGRFDNKDDAIAAGLFCSVRVNLGQPEKKLLVPERALGSEQGRKFVFVVNKENVVQARNVEAGALVGTMRVIEDGLQGDELVITNGMQRVRPGITVDPRPDEQK